MELNWVDLLLCAFILLSLAMGWLRGFMLGAIDLAAWVAGLSLGLYLYAPIAQWLVRMSGWPAAWSRPIAFLSLFFIGLFAVRLLTGPFLSRLPRQAHAHPANKALGTLPGLVNGLIHAVVASALLLAVPLPESMQRAALDSELANRFSGYAEVAEATLMPVFDEAIGETMNMLTVQPETSEMVKLPFTVKNSTPKATLEAQMLEMVKRKGLPPA
jgi:uncharacterized membrane protein required for colicin V production